MGCKINPTTISKLLSALNEYFDSKYRGQLYNITNFSVTSGCNELDNFLSSIYKVHVTTRVFTTVVDSEQEKQVTSTRNSSQDYEFNFICKTTIIEDSPEYRDNLEKYYWSILFTKEKIVFDFLDELNELSKELENEEKAALSCKMYHCFTEGEDYSCLILDDLVFMGYYMPKTLEEGLSITECKLIMKSLARLHALSLGR